MLERLAHMLGVSPAVAGILLALGVVQVATQAYALVDLVRRDAVRGGRKWVWALVIALGNLPGAIAYLAAGRMPPTIDVTAAMSGASTAGGEAARRAVDALYGRGDQR
jgi:membrane associated rhomboid family serine protease